MVVADESVDFGIINGLRSKGVSVYSILEKDSGVDDNRVREIAIEKDALLITEDKDFGELTFRLKLKHRGIILIRLNDLPRSDRLTLAVETIYEFRAQMENSFSVLTKKGLRIKNPIR